MTSQIFHFMNSPSLLSNCLICNKCFLFVCLFVCLFYQCLSLIVVMGVLSVTSLIQKKKKNIALYSFSPSVVVPSPSYSLHLFIINLLNL